MLKDGSTPTCVSSSTPDVTFTSGYDGDIATSPITISNYWLYKFDNCWTQVGESSTLNIENFFYEEPWSCSKLYIYGVYK